MARIVLISATDPSRSAVVAALEGRGHDVLRREHGVELRDITLLRPEILLFETAEGVPVAPAIARILRNRDLGKLPVLVILDAARLPLIEQVEDVSDFVVKPFAGEELRTRVRRLLRTVGGEERSKRVKFGDLVIAADAWEVFRGEERIDLTYKEFELLRFLGNNPSRAFSREELLDAVWGYDYFGGPRTVDVHVRRVRAKLGPSLGRLIVTVRHVGYKLDPRALD